MESADSRSRNNKRPRGVADALQVSEHVVECHSDEASNVFANDPSGSDLLNNSKHLMPEVAVVILALLLTGDAPRLARESAADEIDASEPSQSICIEAADVFEAGDLGPVLSEHGSAVGIDLAECNGSHACAFEAETESADAAE